MKKGFSLEKNLGFGQGVKWQGLWQGFDNDDPLGRRNEDDFPGGKATEPLQKEKQSKNQINQKKKKRAKNQAVTASFVHPNARAGNVKMKKNVSIWMGQ